MKLAFALLFSIVTATGLAGHAHADPDANEQPSAEDAAVVENAVFIDSLHAAGITFNSPDQAIAAGRAVCGLANKGEPPLQIIVDLKSYNPGFTADSAHKFATIAANSYCAHQLVKK